MLTATVNRNSSSFRTEKVPGSVCNLSLIIKKVEAATNGTFTYTNERYRLSARLFQLPENRDGTDAALIKDYQNRTINPITFRPLDYFTQANANQQFFHAQIYNEERLCAEYFCPYVGDVPLEEMPPVMVHRQPSVEVSLIQKMFNAWGEASPTQSLPEPLSKT